ncbi:MAG: NADH-quinone oxidoreductase subunit L [Bacteroidetes bacterium]|nr:MAG: NADH-quinone oxidoreductase subunit L [Bacteroidota bacterium]REK00762.1 MAG: NADH-quinone oxidoreductase subunit L [Bacteroidota bacterium]REK35010.1 MAG: NADH-quinone oxidoreductase subunit L [Bacteroidota bacterium]REK48192.1 MAG: NADH-quinone oxidoreductase subunit L [Bacteroidota bacterium]
MMLMVWLIPLLPLLGFLFIGLLQKKLEGTSAGWIGSLTVLASFVLSLLLFFLHSGSSDEYTLFEWINLGVLSIPFSLMIDQLSLIMMLIVTGVGFLIHVYSIGYMKGDDGFARFFSYLNLFIFFMLILVMGSNFLLMFVGWEGVGLCSYLLIGFWFKTPEYNAAANKAFIMNRIGDLGFLLGILLIISTFGSLDYNSVFSSAASMPDNQPQIIAITLLLLIGAAGKSAQIPLYTWLPDAMAGPTPVSALIHAATMVTAGIYMVVRSNVLYSIAPDTLFIVAVLGTATAVFAATIALAQNDIKKVLAYSTVSQLGFMFAALGAGAYTTAIFHVTTHAFFKALLFLAAGSVIHAMGGEQDIRKMGGLKKNLPVTFTVFAIGTLAIAGIPPLAGFFSKDEILAHVWVEYKYLFVALALASVFTAVYMFRLFFLTFYGDFRGSQRQKEHLHESPGIMTTPLVILAILSAFGGFLGMPEIFSDKHIIGSFLQPVLAYPSQLILSKPSHAFEWSLISVFAILLLIIILYTYRKFVSNKNIPLEDGSVKGLSRVLMNKYYVDELYDYLVVKPAFFIGRTFHSLVEKSIIDRTVNSIKPILISTSGMLRRIQTGGIGFYIFIMVFSIIAILAYNLLIS